MDMKTLKAIADVIYRAEVRGPGFVRVEIHEEGLRAVCIGTRGDQSTFEGAKIASWIQMEEMSPVLTVDRLIREIQQEMEAADIA
jgi:hypothetical protein